jgi:hypothetical protein
VFSSGWSQGVERMPETNRAQCPDRDSSPSTTHFWHRPSPGSAPPWGHRPRNAQAPLDGAAQGLKATLAISPSAVDLLHSNVFSMAWHHARSTRLARPLASVFFAACFGRWVPSPRAVWRLPVAPRPRVANDLLSVRVQPPVTRCSLRLATTTGRPVGGAPISPTASLQGPAVSRAASTSTQDAAALRTAIPLTPLCALPPLGRPRW